MLSEIEPIIYELITIFGLPFVVVAIFLRGILIGKFLPITVIIPAYVIISGVDTVFGIFVLTLLTAFSKTLGQIFIYRQSRKIGRGAFDFVPYMNQDEDKVESVFSAFKKHGGMAIFLGNLLFLRDLMAIPAGTEGYPAAKFILLIYVSTLLNHFILTYVIAEGFRVFFL